MSVVEKIHKNGYHFKIKKKDTEFVVYIEFAGEPVEFPFVPIFAHAYFNEDEYQDALNFCELFATDNEFRQNFFNYGTTKIMN